MPGNPALTCPVGFATTIQVDLTDILVEQPVGTTVVEVDSSQPFFVSAKLRVGGFFTGLHFPYTIKYFFTGFGGATSGALPSAAGFLDAGGVPAAGCGLANDYVGAVTRITVPASTLAADQTYQITAVADFPTLATVEAFTAPTIIGTSP